MHQDGQDRKEMFDEVNANVIIVPQVENYKTVEILEDILTVDGIDFYGGGAEDMAQSMGLPGGHADPRVDKVYDDMKAKLKAAGKFWYGDYVETVHVTGMTKDGIERLLKDHGRESEMGW
jgi:2-keto-3-deoxy-L-rhamnonate aldolase RhmA